MLKVGRSLVHTDIWPCLLSHQVTVIYTLPNALPDRGVGALGIGDSIFWEKKIIATVSYYSSPINRISYIYTLETIRIIGG